MRSVMEIDVFAFRVWLLTRDPLSMVGVAACDRSCPVAHWLGEVYGKQFLVGIDGIGIIEKHVAGVQRLEAPGWVGEFVRGIDEYCDYQQWEVSAASSLRVLNGLLGLGEESGSVG